MSGSDPLQKMSRPQGEAPANFGDEPLRVALALLARGDHSQMDLAVQLARRGFLPIEVDEALARLEGWGFLDDSRAADARLRRFTGRRAKGIELLREDLARHGIDEETIDAAILARFPVEEAERAFALLLERYKSPTPVARAARFLASRGFDEEAVESAVERALAEGRLSEMSQESPDFD